MKKIALLTFLLITVLLKAQEKTKTKQRIRFGVKAGVNFSDARGDINRTRIIMADLPLWRYHAGGFAEIKLSKKISIQPEILYSQKGFASGMEIKDPWEIGHEHYESIKIRNELNYIDIPIMMKFYFVKRVSVELGPQIGFLVSSSKVYNPLLKTDADGFSKVDFALNLGMSVNLGKHSFIGIRSNIGVTDMLNGNDKKGYNRVFQISSGYRF